MERKRVCWPFAEDLAKFLRAIKDVALGTAMVVCGIWFVRTVLEGQALGEYG